MFKNLILFQLPVGYKSQADFEEAFSKHPLRPCGALERRTEGFISPFGENPPSSFLEDGTPVRDEISALAFTHEMDGRTLFTIGFEEKVLPGSVVNKAVRDEVARIKSTEERKVGGKEKKKIKEEIIDRLLPKAFVRQGSLQGYIDIKEGWVVFNTSGLKGAENALSLVRKAIGTCPAVPAPSDNGRLILTQWLSTQELPENLEVGEECELKDPGEGGGTVRCTKQDLSLKEIQDHLKAGKQVTKLAFRYRDRMSFALNETLCISKIKLEDVKEEADESMGAGSSHENLDAEFALMVLEFSQLFQDLRAWFEFERPDKDAPTTEED